MPNQLTRDQLRRLLDAVETDLDFEDVEIDGTEYSGRISLRLSATSLDIEVRTDDDGEHRARFPLGD